jgi:hypothetical protein
MGCTCIPDWGRFAAGAKNYVVVHIEPACAGRCIQVGSNALVTENPYRSSSELTAHALTIY